MDFRVFTAAVVFIAAAAGTASAQQPVTLQFHDGQVTLSAQNAPVRTILSEWARLGGATIVNAERVAGPPVTLELAGVSEREALDILLRSVAGYIVAPRRAGSHSASAFDRIMILPTSVAPRNPAPAPTTASGRRPPITRPAFLARPPDPPDAAELEAENQAEQAEQAEQEDAAANTQGRIVRPPVVIRGSVDTETEDDDAADDGENEDETAAAGVTTTPGNPFGVPAGSSATPGVISPAPQPQGQRQRPSQAPARVQ